MLPPCRGEGQRCCRCTTFCRCITAGCERNVLLCTNATNLLLLYRLGGVVGAIQFSHQFELRIKLHL